MNVPNVPVQRLPTVNVFLSYASDGAQAAHLFRDQLGDAVASRGIRADFTFTDGGSGRATVKGADAGPPAPGPRDVLVAFLSPGYRSEVGLRHVEEHLKESGSAALRFGVTFADARMEAVRSFGALQFIPSLKTDLLLPAGRVGSREIAPVIEDFLHFLAAFELVPAPTFGPHAVDAPQDAVDHLESRYPLSDNALPILQRAAGETLERGSDAVLDTASVLLAIIDVGSASETPQWSGDWAAGALANAAPPLRERVRSGTGPRLPDSLRPPVSAGLAAVLEDASAIARQASGSDRIHPRHLLAAILRDGRGGGSRALEIVAGAGLDPPTLRHRFYDFARGDSRDDETAWSRVLLGGIVEAPRHSAFHADDTDSADFLDVTPDVLAFAGLIAARTIKPPLSIGLFGEWGSGKSFFMNLLRREVAAIAAKADASEEMQKDLVFYKRIVQIEFNAWHYVEENLWASLANRIFEALHGVGATSASRELHDRLSAERDRERALAQKAEEEQRTAEAEVRTAAEELESAKRAFAEETERLATPSGRSLLASIDAAEVRALAAGMLERLGFVSLTDSAAELRGELHTARAELNGVWSVLAPLRHGTPRERTWRGVLLVAGFFATTLAGYGVHTLFPHDSETVRSIAAAAAGLATLVSGAAAWIRRFLPTVRRWREEVEAVQRRLDARVVEAYDRLTAVGTRLEARNTEAEAARRRLEDARGRVARAEARLRSASLAEELKRFVADRVVSGEYRSQLSTLARVREDLETLSELIEEENWRLDPPVAGEDTSRRGLKKFETADEEAKDRVTRVNRIVLYIDDLDRCPPAKVVEVLQAVHLLLAFPLFVVVVGVDARWVTRSIETRYRELLKEEHRASDEFRELFGAATAHDYLEKIFQVPFWLRPMTEVGTRQMVEGLLAGSLASNGEDGAEMEGGTAQATAGRSADPPSDGNPSANAALDTYAMDDASEAGSETSAPGEATATSTVGSRPPKELAPGSLEIHPAELAFMRELAPLLGRSPRALKRFVNVYRLVKAGLSPEQHRAFLAEEPGRLSESRAVLFLLAVDTGAPRAAREMLDLLRPAQERGGGKDVPRDLEVFLIAMDRRASDEPDWRRVRAWLEPRPEEFALANDVPALARAAKRVRRFSFHTGRAARHGADRAEQHSGPEPA